MGEIMTIGIVDDNSIYRKLLIKILQLGGFSVIFQAEDGIDCLSKMESNPLMPCLVLMDIEMPVMDGFETTRQLKIRWPHLKIIAHSSIDDIEAIERIMQCGADTFLPKPCSINQMMAAIKEFQ
ncbi:response regulator [Mucilaginibacter paludis]|uniref:Response regulator receiver protein n=1 Tax=Mucilaginibacter paludis DSM 18603 TaxID=714943 RepID=H1Y7S1_9SPHI|nr:response regulator [Mucilaginibacter paludis]EHQ29916.1 response regulator receiver protein [Mucilaginibacter paludis DSM 18603]